MSVKCLYHIVAKVLIDNGSSLNVMPKDTFYAILPPRELDRSRCDIRGEIDLSIQIGSHTCQITFQVMDINPAYSCLLGQPWIHSVGVVPSMLHQKLECVVKGQLVIVSGEKDILVSCPCSTPYVEAAKESLEASFQALEM